MSNFVCERRVNEKLPDVVVKERKPFFGDRERKRERKGREKERT